MSHTRENKRDEEPKIKSSWKAVRDVILFGVGIAGIVHEEFFTDKDRHWLLLLYSGMIGLTAWLRLDERRSGDE